MSVHGSRHPDEYITEKEFFKAFARATRDPSKLEPVTKSTIQSLEKREAERIALSLMRWIPSRSRTPHADSTVQAVKNAVEGFFEHSDKSVEDRVNVLGAQIFAATNSGGIVEEIKKRKIASQEERMEILAIAAKRQEGLAQWIKELEITDPKMIVELVLARLKYDKEEVFSDIRKYGIQDQETMLKILYSVAEGSSSNLREWMKRCEVTDENLFVELVKTGARHQYQFSKSIPELGISDPDLLLSIAKVAAETDASFFEYLGNYKVEEQQRLVELGKIGAKSNLNFCREFKKLGIKDEADRIEMAKIAARNPRLKLSKYIGNFDIGDKAALIEIAKISAAHSGEETAKHITKYGIDDRGVLNEILFLSIQNDMDAINYVDQFFKSDELKGYAPVGTSDFRLKELAALHVVGSRLFQKSLQEHPLIQNLKGMKSPRALKVAVHALSRYASDQPLNSLVYPFDCFLPEVVKRADLEPTLNRNDRRDYVLQSQLLITFQDILSSSSSEKAVQNVVAALNGLRGTQNKVAFLEEVSALLSLAGELPSEGGNEAIQKNLQSVFMQFLGLELHSEPNFGAKFLNTFGRFRHLNYLIIYASQLKKLPGSVKERVIEDLKCFTLDILNGQFEVNRNRGLPAGWVAGSCEKVSERGVNFKVRLNELIKEGHFAHLGENLKKYLNDPGTLLPDELDPIIKYSVLLSREGGQHLDALHKALQEITPPSAKLLGAVQELIQNRVTNKDEYTLVDSSDPEDFLEMGVVVQSCQKVSDDPTYSKGLLGTSLNGHDRLLLLKDPNGNTIGRALLRLMRSGEKEVLFVERVYPLAWKDKAIVIDFAIRRARELGLPLYANDDYIVEVATAISLKSKRPLDATSKKIEFPKATLSSQPGPGSWEYVDAMHGMVERGDYFVPDSLRIDSPDS